MTVRNRVALILAILGSIGGLIAAAHLTVEDIRAHFPF